MEKLVVLSGAGMSADSGIKTFRDADGLWEGHDVMQVASPEGFAANPELVLEFYNQRRRQLKEVLPNPGHIAIASLQEYFDVQVITQNIDDLHERAGSRKVVHLHGELLKARSTGPEMEILNWEGDLVWGDLCSAGYQLRPHIVWFGEAVPELEFAAHLTAEADILMVVGTSLQVYPAAGLLHYKASGIPLYLIDPRPALLENAMDSLEIIKARAAEGVPILAERLIDRVRG
ncbi:SIR2 family NAD-dependent protein deacylase [Robiginitalea sp. IMCC44478]|uniref:SIR2 family NAD-dependent protein deacylase n=1 Tax=Robiginitalea sp. IMCC44478 TaxID=3459122 RepID=UPI004041C2CA